MTKTLADYPKRLYINRPILDQQFVTEPMYTCELISMRTLRRKMDQLRLVNEQLTAPSGYRLYRIWRGNNVSTESEIHID